MWELRIIKYSVRGSVPRKKKSWEDCMQIFNDTFVDCIALNTCKMNLKQLRV